MAVVQQQLISLGYLKGKADGVFGNNTYAAVIQFQLAHDLEPDGIVGENTLTWLFSGEAIALPTATPEPTPEPTPVDLEYPYYIEIDRGMQVVRVYTIGEDGTYSLLAREMICSTDTFGYKPPQGTYKMNGEKLRWMMSLFGTYAQYATRISGHILFHAVPTTMCYANTLNADDYRALGTNASAGCVRLLCADAKWIYDNVPAGTMVRYVNNPRDEEKLKELAAPPLGSGNWDPTDNREDNPDYDPSYEASKPLVTPALGVTPAPTEPWTPDVYN